MPSAIPTIHRVFESSSSAEDFIKQYIEFNNSKKQHPTEGEATFHDIVITDIIRDIAGDIQKNELRTWQWQAYRSLFNAKMKYYSCHRNLVRYANDGEDEDYAPSILSKLTSECNQCERDALMVGIRAHMLEQLNKLCMMIS